MTDKEKILAKIESLLNETNYEPFTDEVFGRIQILKELKSYIDFLQEEPVNEDLEKEIDNYIKDNFFGSETYGFCSNRTGGELDCVDVVNIARHFANWQKEQDKETIEFAEDHAMFAGMVKGKEEAIKKTIDFLNWIIGTGNSIIEEYKKYMNN